MRQTSIARHSGTRGWLVPAAEGERPAKHRPDEIYIRVFLSGARGSIAWGYHPAAELSSWRIAKDDKNQWTLTGTVARVEPFYLRQRSPTLLFTAPKAHTPEVHPWCFPVTDVGVQGTTLKATLGNVEF